MNVLSRRKFLKTIIISAGSVSASGLLAGCHEDKDKPSARSTSEIFPQSIASGDPRANSVVLWTRVEETRSANTDLEVGLEVSTTADFATLVVGEFVPALAAHDRCVKVRVTGLQPGTTYYYRFTYDGTRSNTGRTRTAPDANSDTPVKFAYASCQDYIGRYYNSYLALLDEDLDFLVFLGDYIYETTGDDQFQGDPGARSIEFNDSTGVLRVGSDDDFFYAAGSLDNYRQLYKVYRSDPMLQKVHERFAFINIWDDHEYSDDSWMEHASYYDGAKDESNSARRRIAEQAFFEFTPIDQESVADSNATTMGSITVDDDQLFPATRIYRDFQFGRHLQLFMTDFRTYRPDHLIPEDAFPGIVVMTQDQLQTYFSGTTGGFAAVQSKYAPYVNINDVQYSTKRDAMRAALTTAYQEALSHRGIDPALEGGRITSLVDAATTGFVAADQINNYLDDSLKFTDLELAAMPRGLAYSSMGKFSLFTDVGSRYFVIKPVYDVYADYLASLSGTPNVYGDAQMQWLSDGLRSSTATWKVVGSSVSFSPIILDLGEPALPFIAPFYAAVPESFRQSFYFNVDHWDGFPLQKNALLTGLLGETGAITIAGDVHSAYVTEHPITGTGRRSFDFTGTAISSGTWAEFSTIAANSSSSYAPLAALVPLLNTALEQATTRDEITSKVQFAATSEHGVSIVAVTGTSMLVTYKLFPSEVTEGTEKVSIVGQNFYDNSSAYFDLMRTVRFQVQDGVLTRLE